MYARGTSVREIVEHLYGVDVPPDLISAVTDAVLDEVAAWQARPPRTCLPARLFDALRIKIRGQGLARNEAVYVALGVRADGTKEILGLWLEQNEGAKFWLRVMNELKTRGVGDIPSPSLLRKTEADQHRVEAGARLSRSREVAMTASPILEGSTRFSLSLAQPKQERWAF